MEELNFYLDSAKESMQSAIDRTATDFSRIRAGKATPTMLDGIFVDYFGARTPLSQVASINTPDARTMVIKPWEKNLIGAIETAIINSDLGLNPQNDGDTVKLFLPPLTEERRKELVKNLKAGAEQGKISIRNIRKETNEELKKLKNDGLAEDDFKRAEEQVQKLTDSFIAKIDDLTSKKEVEIMKV